MISAIASQTPAASSAPPAETAAFSGSSDFNMFLKMLTTQMQNQNPLNPVEAADFAVQLATFSGVEQQVQTNQLLARLTERSLSGDLATWLGTDVAAGKTTEVGQTDLHLHLPAAPQGTTRREVVFKTLSGQEVWRSDVPPSQSSFRLDPIAGPILAGTYQTEVEDFAGGELLGTSAAPQFLRVQEVQNTPSGTSLVLEFGLRVDPADVAAIRKP